jgi:hypothetical protein
MGKKGINTYKQHVVKMLDKRLGAREPLECTKEVGDVLMCWGTIFTSATAQYDPTKCKKQEETLFKCQLAMESGSLTKQRRSMKASIIHQVLTIANNSTNAGKFRPK